MSNQNILFFSGSPADSANLEMLKNASFTHILNCSIDQPNRHKNDFTYKNINFGTLMDSSMEENFREIIAFIG